MEIIPVPTLSSKGWVTDPVEKIDFLLSHYFESEDKENVQTLLVMYGDDIQQFIEKLRARLVTYLGRYFNLVELDIYEPPTQDANSPKVELRIACTVTDVDGIARSIGVALTQTNSRFNIFVNINNTGSDTRSLV